MHSREDDDTTPDDVRVLQELSNEMTRLFKLQFGRGPVRVRSFWSGPDALTVLLEETLTPAERRLIAIGERQRLRDLRLVFQDASLRESCEVVERLTSRKVKAFLSAIDPDVEGLCSQVFVLHPPGYDGPSRFEAPAPGEQERRPTRRSGR